MKRLLTLELLFIIIGISLLCSTVSAGDDENWDANRLASIDPQHDARLTILPRDISGDLAGPWYQKGLTLMESRDYKDALVAFNEAISIAPNLPDAWGAKGNALDKLGNYSEAIEAYKHDPDDPDIQIGLADAQRHFNST
jgi:tetratricopeptide (TPR) repeat protein